MYQMKAVVEIMMDVIFLVGAVTIPFWAINKIRNETLTKVSRGLTPLSSFTDQLIKNSK